MSMATAALRRLASPHVLTTPWILYGGSHRSLDDKRDEVIAKFA